MTVHTKCPLCESGQSALEMPWESYQLLRCTGCDLVYADPLQIPDTLYDTAYETPGHDYEAYFRQSSKVEDRGFHVAWSWRHFYRYLGPGDDRSLLDVGCSTGVFLVTAQDRGWKTTGIEISPTAAAVAEQRGGSVIHVGTINTAPLPPAHYEAVTSWEILEHVVDPIDFAGRVFSALKPGGYWGLSTPNWDSPWERAAKQAMRKPPFHLTFWNAATIRRLLGTAGFQVCEVKEKPLAWTEELGRKKWVYLPVAVFRKLVLQHKANRLYALARKPL